MLITQIGEDWDTGRARVNRLLYDLRQHVRGNLQVVYHVEPNPSGDGQNHGHFWTHGAYIPQQLLSELADRRGMGSVARVNRIRDVTRASRYGLKGLGYGLKNVRDGHAAEYLLANGRRLTHQSRGFFRDAAGVSRPVRVAEQMAVQSAGVGDPGPWRILQS